MSRHLIGQIGHAATGGRRQAAGQVFVGKVDFGFQMGLKAHQTPPPIVVKPGQGTLHLAECLATLGCGVRRHQIGDRFRLGEIELPRRKGSPAELAGLGGTHPQRQQSLT